MININYYLNVFYYCNYKSVNLSHYVEKEKDLVEEVFKNAISSLSEEDKKLPQVL